MIVIKHGPTEIKGVLRSYTCGSGKILLNLVPDIDIELRGIPNKLLFAMNGMGLARIKDSVIEVASGKIFYDKTIARPTRQTQSVDKAKKSEDVAPPTSRLISKTNIRKVPPKSANQPSVIPKQKEMKSLIG